MTGIDPTQLHRLASDISYAIVDHFQLLLPRDWHTIKLELEPDLRRIRDVNVEGHTGGEQGSFRWAEVAAQTDMLLGRLRDLTAVFGQLGYRWDTRRLVCAWPRTGNIVLQLIGKQYTVPSIGVDPAELNFGQALFTALEQLAPRWKELERRHRTRLAAISEWSFDYQTACLNVVYEDKRSATFRGEILGSYRRADRSWCWAWANPSLQEFRRAFAATAQLAQASADWPGMRCFGIPRFASDPMFLGHLTRLAAAMMDAVVFADTAVDQELILYHAIRPVAEPA